LRNIVYDFREGMQHQGRITLLNYLFILYKLKMPIFVFIYFGNEVNVPTAAEWSNDFAISHGNPFDF
jgi:hypothetical protein